MGGGAVRQSLNRKRESEPELCASVGPVRWMLEAWRLQKQNRNSPKPQGRNMKLALVPTSTLHRNSHVLTKGIDRTIQMKNNNNK